MPTTTACNTYWGVSTSDFSDALGNFIHVINPPINYTYATTTSTSYSFTYNPIRADIITAGSTPAKIRKICHCDYCGTAYDDEEEFVSNCKNCGAIIKR